MWYFYNYQLKDINWKCKWKYKTNQMMCLFYENVLFSLSITKVSHCFHLFSVFKYLNRIWATYKTRWKWCDIIVVNNKSRKHFCKPNTPLMLSCSLILSFTTARVKFHSKNFQSKGITIIAKLQIADTMLVWQVDIVRVLS